MTPDEIHIWAKALILKIFVITGWPIPVEEMQSILLDQFKKKIAESYGICNPDEVEYAFRQYGTDIEDWGKKMNLSFIDKVMIRYLKRRAELSILEEHKTPPRPGIENKENLSHFGYVRWLAQEIRHIKTGKPFELIPLELCEYFRKLGKIKFSIEEKFEYLGKAAAWRAGQLQKDAERKSSVDNLRALEQFRAMREKDNFSVEEFERLKRIAKKLVFFDIALKK